MPTKRSKRPTIAHIPALKYKQGYVIRWDNFIEAISKADLVEFKGTQVGGKTLLKLVKAMQAGDGVLLTKIVLNGEEPNPPFQGLGLQMEVGPERRYRTGALPKWMKADKKPFYSRIRVATGAWLPKKVDNPQIVRLEPRIIKVKKEVT